MAYNVKFLKGTGENYAALQSKDKNTFYYIDNKYLYLGDILLSNGEDIAGAISRIAVNEASIKTLQDELDALVDPDGTGGGSISTQINTLRSDLTALINENTAAIEAEKTRATNAESQLSTDLTNVQNQLNGLSGAMSSMNTDLSGKITDLTSRVSANETNIDAQSTKLSALIGGDENMTVRAIAAAELAKQLVPENAQESLDTLEEIAAWIQAHPSDASEMNEQIQANKNSIDGMSSAISSHTTDIQGLKDQFASITAADTGILKQAKDYTDAQLLPVQNQVTANKTSIEALLERVGANETAIENINDPDEGVLAQAKIELNNAIANLKLGTAAQANIEDFDAAGSAAAAEANAIAYTDAALTWGTIVIE